VLLVQGGSRGAGCVIPPVRTTRPMTARLTGAAGTAGAGVAGGTVGSTSTVSYYSFSLLSKGRDGERAG